MMPLDPETLRMLAMAAQQMGGQGLGMSGMGMSPQGGAPLAPPQAAPPMQPMQPQKKPGVFARMRGGIGETLLPTEQGASYGMTPEQIQAAQAAARKQLGLGMLLNSLQGNRGNPMALAEQGLGGLRSAAMQRANQEREDKRFNLERTDRADERALTREERADARAYREQQDKLDQNNWDRNFDATERWRKEQLEQDKKRGKKEQTANQRFVMIDKTRNEYTKRKQKVLDGQQQAEMLLQLANNPNIANDPSAQTAAVFAFGRMIDPESTVREGEYQLFEKSRGLYEELQMILPKLSTGARLSPEQVKRMADVARQIAGKGSERVLALDQYYNELSTRRGIDPFEVTGQSSRSTVDSNTIDVGDLFSKGGGGTTPKAFYPQGQGGPKVVPVDY